VKPTAARKRIVIIGPVFPFRAGIAYCTTRLATELTGSFDVEIASFSRQFPQRFYPGSSDVDPSLESKRPQNARFRLDVINPLTWISEGLWLRRAAPDAVIFVWWIWVWALPYLAIMALLRRKTAIILQCHNIGDKEPAGWKSWLSNRVLRRGSHLVVHAGSEGLEARRRLGKSRGEVVETFLPVHELGGEIPTREEARKLLGISGNASLFFGHVRPFKGLDIALRAWSRLQCSATLLVAGEVWWNDEQSYRELVEELELHDSVRLDFRFIPDDEIALWFAATDVVITPYRREAQSGVALTAFHFERPVIATRVGGVPEIISDDFNGYLVPPEDPAALAAAIDRFFLSGDRRAMEKGARETARKFSWEQYGSVVARVVDRATSTS
jgi:glycosyltransferase involved in cell wall biosynthesis